MLLMWAALGQSEARRLLFKIATEEFDSRAQIRSYSLSSIGCPSVGCFWFFVSGRVQRKWSAHYVTGR